MKKNWFLGLLLLILMGVFALSCANNEDLNQDDFDFTNMNENGKVFIDNIQTIPDWGKHWHDILKEGQPLPNEVVTMVRFPKGDIHYVLPVVRDNEITSIVYYPLEKTIENQSVNIGSPVIVNKEQMNKNRLVASYLKTKPYTNLQAKGYSVSNQESQSEEISNHSIQTLSSFIPIGMHHYFEVVFTRPSYAIIGPELDQQVFNYLGALDPVFYHGIPDIYGFPRTMVAWMHMNNVEYPDFHRLVTHGWDSGEQGPGNIVFLEYEHESCALDFFSNIALHFGEDCYVNNVFCDMYYDVVVP